MKQLLHLQLLLRYASDSAKDRQQPCKRKRDHPAEQVRVGSDLFANHRQKEDDPAQHEQAETLQLCVSPRQSPGQKAHDDLIGFYLKPEI
jgi:hypothetical protein